MKGSTPLYPGRPFKPRERTLALEDGHALQILGEDPWDEHPCPTYEEWIALVLLDHLEVRVDSILGFRFFREALADPHATISAARSLADQHPRPVSITWRYGNKWASLFTAEGWGDGATVDSVSVHHLTCEHLEAGTYASASSLGQATIRAHLSQHYPTLSKKANQVFLDHLTGGRAELPEKMEVDNAWEIDRAMAYVAEARNPLPVGAATYLGVCDLESANNYPHWFGRCAVLVLHRLPLGPFPLRLAPGRVKYPTEPGRYVVWLWKEEARACLDAGCIVIPESLWAFTRSIPALSEWSEWIYAKRATAPDPYVAGYVKRAAVAAIGWLAMSPWRLRVIHATADTPNRDIIRSSNGFLTPYAVEMVYEKLPRQMPHWASYIWALARLTLYERQLAEYRSGNHVLASNFDSLLLGSPTILPVANTLGGWRQAELSHVDLPANRHLISDQKIRRPGIPARPKVR